MPGFALETEGLRETLAGLDKVARLDVTRDLKVEFNRLAEDAMNRATGKAGTAQRRRAADTLRLASTGTYAALAFGKGFAGAFGAEFGAYQGQRRVVTFFGYFTGWNQFDRWRGSGGDAGYFLWPGIREAAKENVELLAESVAAIAAGRPAGGPMVDFVGNFGATGKL